MFYSCSATQIHCLLNFDKSVTYPGFTLTDLIRFLFEISADLFVERVQILFGRDLSLRLVQTGTIVALEEVQTVRLVSLWKDEQIIGIQMVRRARHTHLAICREIITRKMKAIASCACAWARNIWPTLRRASYERCVPYAPRSLSIPDISHRCGSWRSNPAAAIVIESSRVEPGRVESS